MTASQFCFFHDPAKSAERRVARSRGGIERTRKRVSLPADTPVRPLKDSADARQLLGEMIPKVLLDELDPRLATCVAYLCTVFLNAQVQSQIEKRLAELEAFLRAQFLEPQPIQKAGPDPVTEAATGRMAAENPRDEGGNSE